MLRRLPNRLLCEPQDTAKTDHDFNVNVIDPKRQIQESEFQNDVLTRCKNIGVLEILQHFDSDFSASRRQYDDGTARYFTRFTMFRKHVNGEEIKREYSPFSGNVYCFPCVLLCDAEINYRDNGKSGSGIQLLDTSECQTAKW